MPTPRVSERLEGTTEPPVERREPPPVSPRYQTGCTSQILAVRLYLTVTMQGVTRVAMHQPQLLGTGETWLAIDKPAGLPVFPPHDDATGPSLLSWLLLRHPDQAAPSWPVGFEGGIAHRLDVSTSGQVLVARDPGALVQLRELFARHLLLKEYRFLSWREVPWSEHRLDRPIAHDRQRRARMIVQRGQSTPHRGAWYPAETTFRRASPGHRLSEGRLSEWSAFMKTGVMHQIRVHAAFAGLALAGDGLYGGGPPTPAATAWAQASGLPSPPFHLHHVGLCGSGLEPPRSPCPSWWRTC